MKTFSMLAILASVLALNSVASAGDTVQRVVVQEAPTVTPAPACHQTYVAPQAVTVQRVIVQEVPVQHVQRVIVQQAPVQHVQRQRVIVQQQSAYGYSQAFQNFAAPQRVIVQQSPQRQRQAFGGGGNGNILNNILRPTFLLGAAGAAGGASVGGPGGAAIGAGVGNLLGQALER